MSINMKNILFNLTLIFLFTSQTTRAQDLPAYKIYSPEGKEVKFSKMMKEIKEAEAERQQIIDNIQGGSSTTKQTTEEEDVWGDPIVKE